MIVAASSAAASLAFISACELVTVDWSTHAHTRRKLSLDVIIAQMINDDDVCALKHVCARACVCVCELKSVDDGSRILSCRAALNTFTTSTVPVSIVRVMFR